MKLDNLYIQVKEKNFQPTEERECSYKGDKIFSKIEDRNCKKYKFSYSNNPKSFRILVFFLALIIFNSFSYSNDSLLKSIFVNSVNVKNLKLNTEIKGKLASKGDIPEFCERELVPIVIKAAIGLKVKNHNARETNKDVIQPVPQPSITNNYTIYFYDLLTCLLIIYLILFVLSYLKWYEEMYLVILDYIFRGYFHFLDLTDKKNIDILNGKNFKDSKDEIKNNEIDGQNENKNEAENNQINEEIEEENPLSETLIQRLEDEAIYINGRAIIGESASDVIFKPILNDYSDVKFMKIQRKVEIYDPIAKMWEPLILRGNNKNNFFNDESEKFQTTYQRNFSICELDENVVRIQFDQGSFLIPKIVCENFNAENVSLRGVLLSDVHFNQLRNNEIIKLNSLTQEELNSISGILNLNLDNFNSRDRGLNNNDKRSNMKRKNQNDDRNANENIFFDNENMNDIRLVSEFDNEDNKTIKKFPKPAVNKDNKLNGNNNILKKNTFDDENQQTKSSFRLEKSNDFIYIIPIEETNFQDQLDENQQLNGNNPINFKDDKCQIRVSFYGYRENQISILAQIKEKRFKSVATPYIDDYYKNGLNNNVNKMDNANNLSRNYSYTQNDIKIQNNKNINVAEGNQEINKTNSSFVANMTTNMVLKTNVEMSFLNLFFCCCFNPLPIYIFDKTEALRSFSYTLVNWVYEGKMNKEQFLYKKHKVSLTKLWINRLFVTVLIFLILYVFPGLISLTYSIFSNVLFGKTISTEMTRNLFFIIVDTIITISLVVSIIIYTKLGYNGRFICFILSSVLVITLFVMILIYYLKNREAIKLEFTIKK